MKKQPTTIALIAIVAVALVVAVAWGTITLLSSVNDDKNNTTANKTPESQTDKEEQPEETPSFGEPDINEDQNKEAGVIEKEATDLMESDPAEARKKYLAAADAYRKAGNVAKVSEMQANATTAEALVEDLSEQQSQSSDQ